MQNITIRQNKGIYQNVPREKLNHNINIPWGSFFVNLSVRSGIEKSREKVWTYCNARFIFTTLIPLGLQGKHLFERHYPQPANPRPVPENKKTSGRSSTKSWKCVVRWFISTRRSCTVPFLIDRYLAILLSIFKGLNTKCHIGESQYQYIHVLVYVAARTRHEAKPLHFSTVFKQCIYTSLNFLVVIVGVP